MALTLSLNTNPLVNRFADPDDLIDIRGRRDAAAERALDKLRERFGRKAILKGLGLGREEDDEP